METAESKNKIVSTALEEYGVLLLSDLRLPSLVGLVVGKPVQGSWWGHPMGGVIYALASRLDDNEDIITTKLISGKVTFVHKRLWPQVVKIGTAKETWQTEKLSEAAKSLLRMVTELHVVETDSLPSSKACPKPGKACDELEKRLLVHAEQFHTVSGAHAKRIHTWTDWASKRNIGDAPVDVQQAKDDLAKVMELLNSKFDARGTLPWQ